MAKRGVSWRGRRMPLSRRQEKKVAAAGAQDLPALVQQSGGITKMFGRNEGLTGQREQMTPPEVSR